MDDIVREVREIREAYARRFNYDLDAIHRDLVEQQEKLKAEGWRMVSFQPHQPAGVPLHDEPVDESQEGNDLASTEGSDAIPNPDAATVTP